MKAPNRFFYAYANFIVRHPLWVLVTLLVLGIGAFWASLHLTINSNQLDLISQDLQEVKDVKRVIDMVGGTGHLMLGLRSADEKVLKGVSDDIADMLTADKEHVRFITYKIPVDFVQTNMVLFVKNEDLIEGKRRINAYLKDQLRRSNPFFIEIRKTEPVKLDLSDLIQKYSHIGKKSVIDDYYISNDRQMILMLIKPMWDNNKLGPTKAFVEILQARFAAYSKSNKWGVKLVEDYHRASPSAGTVTYGFTGSYKTIVDDQYAMTESLGPVTLSALVAIVIITLIFFRRVAPSIIVILGMALGTVLATGFTYITVHELNMVTSILGGILMGFGIDYGIHFTYRTRIELGAGKPYDVAIRDALINAGRPALVAAVVTGGSFFVLMVSEFRGFSQFGFLAGCGTIFIGLTCFSWSPAILALLGKRWPDLPARLTGKMSPPTLDKSGHARSIPRPKLMLAICGGLVAILCAFAFPWRDIPLPKDRAPSLWERLQSGVRFNYNTRALMPEDYPAVRLQDEINDRFNISSDPTAVYTQTLEETKEVWDELTGHPDKYSTIDQVVSIYSFVPPRENAERNAKVLAQWAEELKDIDPSALPPDMQDKAALFKRILAVRPFDAEQVPAIYKELFQNLPTALPENRGWLTFIYPNVDTWDGRKMLDFADQTHFIHTASGKEFRAAGVPILYSRLARMVLHDGKLAVLLVTLWILLMHYADFRSVKLALASVIPLGLGLAMTLGAMSIFNHRLNFMNIIVLPILLGFGVSHGLYLLHRFLEGTSPFVALRSVGAAVASSTLTAVAGFGSLFVAEHNGLRSMGWVACVGLTMTLIVSFTVLAAVLQLMHDARTGQKTPAPAPASGDERSAA
jgi:predicted RND superfamily exporter protein